MGFQPHFPSPNVLIISESHYALHCLSVALLLINLLFRHLVKGREFSWESLKTNSNLAVSLVTLSY